MAMSGNIFSLRYIDKDYTPRDISTVTLSTDILVAWEAVELP